MEEMTIHLQVDAAHFRDICYQNGQGSMFTYKPTRMALKGLLYLSIIAISLYLASLVFTELSWIFFICILFAGASFIAAVYYLIYYWRWRYRVGRYLNDLPVGKKHVLKVNDTAVILMSGDETHMYKWETFKRAFCTGSYISLQADTGSELIIPRPSMQAEEFDALVTAVHSKLS